MGDIQRWGPQEIVKGRDWVPAEMMVYSEGEWVLFTDHEWVVAEKDARIKELEGQIATINGIAQEAVDTIDDWMKPGPPPQEKWDRLELATATLRAALNQDT